MRITRKPVVALVAVALLGIVVARCSLGSNHSWEDREAAARARVSSGISGAVLFSTIKANPTLAARLSAMRGDFRMVRYTVQAMDSTGSPETFSGVTCSIPGSMTVLLTRLEQIDILSDVPPFTQPPIAANAEAARAFNLALLHDPTYPYADLCVETPPKQPVPESMTHELSDLADIADRASWWSRQSSASARLHNDAPPLTIASRNGSLPTNLTREDIDATDEFGMTALGWATARGSREMVAALLKAGADPWFGDYCETREHEGRQYAAAMQNDFTSPVFIAVFHHRSDVLADMIARAPRKECGPPHNSFSSQSGDRAHVIQEVSEFATGPEWSWLRRRMIDDYLDFIISTKDDNMADNYDAMVELAWKNGDGALFRRRPLTEVKRSEKFIGAMATAASAEELKYWMAALDLHTSEKIWALIETLKNWNGGNAQARAAFLAKADVLLDADAKLPQVERDYHFHGLFGSGTLGPISSDPDMVRALFQKFLARGYSVNRPMAGGP